MSSKQLGRTNNEVRGADANKFPIIEPIEGYTLLTINQHFLE